MSVADLFPYRARGPRSHYKAGEPELNYCTQDGAGKLKERIEAYWRERGHHVEVFLEEKGFIPAVRTARFDVRSNMRNGLPPVAALPSRKDQAA